MKMKFFLGFFILLSILITGCSSLQETTRESTQTRDTVDTQIAKPEPQNQPQTQIKENPVTTTRDTLFIVQIGAYNTLEKANHFANNARTKIQREIRVIFSKSVNLYVVQIAPFYTKQEAENYRNELWKDSEFSDSFIVTEEK